MTFLEHLKGRGVFDFERHCFVDGNDEVLTFPIGNVSGYEDSL